jgi:arabinogalactan oligomer/maltooligosaccharide transport system permease protein
MDKKPSLLESILVHTVLLTAVGFALYPILWVVTLAFSPTGLSSTTGALPCPRDPSLENFRIVTGGGVGALLRAARN